MRERLVQPIMHINKANLADRVNCESRYECLMAE